MISERDFQETVGHRLRVLRTAMGKSQAALAIKLGVGDTAISNYEKGVRALDPYFAFKLKLAYGVPLEWLYGGDESALSSVLAEKLDDAEREISRKERSGAGPLPRSVKTAHTL